MRKRIAEERAASPDPSHGRGNRRWIVAGISVTDVVVVVYHLAINVSIMAATGWDSACELLGSSHGLSEREFGGWRNEGINIYNDPRLTCTYQLGDGDGTLTLTRSLAEQQDFSYRVAGVGLVLSAVAANWVLWRTESGERKSASLDPK